MQIYADDTVLYCFSSSIETIQDSLNTDLMAIAEWLNANKLTLNLEKSKFMLFGSEKKLRLLHMMETHFTKMLAARSIFKFSPSNFACIMINRCCS